MTGTLAQTKNEFTILFAEKSQLHKRSVTLETQVKTLLDENKALLIDKARLEGMHRQLSGNKPVVLDLAQLSKTRFRKA